MATKEFPLALVIKAVDKATGPLRRVAANVKKITGPVGKVGAAFKKVGSEVVGLGKTISGMVAAALFGGFGLFTLVKGAIEAGDKLGEMSQRVGLGVDAYASLQYAAGQADVEAEAFNSAMDQFNKRMGEARAGGGSLLSFLKKVSPVLARQVLNTKDNEEALGKLTSAFELVTDPGKRAALAAAAFGKSGLQMGQFLGQGTKAIAVQRKRALELTGSQEEFVEGAGALDNAMKDTALAFTGLRVAAGGALFPALTELAKAITGIVAGNRGSLAAWAKEAGAAISAWVARGGVGELVEGLKGIASTVATVIDKIGGFKGVMIVAGAILAGPLIGAIIGVVSAIATLTATFGAPVLLVLAGVAALAAAAGVVIANWTPIKAFFESLGASISGFFGTLKQVLDSPLLETFKTAKDFYFGAEKAKPSRASTAQVSVDFANAPKGTRVTPAKGNTADVGLNVGYSMGAP